MIIKSFGFGNASEAFIENRFKERVNIIFSDDNNKGKTLVLQGIMYTLGNEPIFPAGFDCTKHYFYLHFNANSKNFKILRKNNTFCVISENSHLIFDSISEFKYFFDKEIYKLPEILHRNSINKVDLSLFLQLFFVGQDKRDTSSIFNSGYYNKTDFIEMLYGLKGFVSSEISTDELKKLQSELKILRAAEEKLTNEIDRFNINKSVIESIKASESYRYFQIQEKNLNKLNEQIVNLRKKRNTEVTRLNNHINLRAELTSLNRAISLGEVVCNDCGSKNIGYKSRDLSFDISNKEVRDSILGSIEESIKIKSELVSKIDYERELVQEELDNEISFVPPELRDLILYKEELKSSGSLDKERSQKQMEISKIVSKINESSIKVEGKSKQRLEMMNAIINVMNSIYKAVDDDGVQVFTELFTKKSVNYSGSEEQEFYFAKTYALQAIFKHPFPIVIDSFRDRELSSAKEMRMIDIFESIDNQVILTSTLKKEEYISEKYESYGNLNVIDYSNHSNSRILSSEYKEKFLTICMQFGVVAN